MPSILTPELREFRIWQLDQEINRRGVYIDEKAVRHAMDACEILEHRLLKELKIASGGRIDKAGQHAEIAAFCGLPDCTADTVDKVLSGTSDCMLGYPNREDLTDRQLRVLQIRRTLSKASVGKLKKMLLCRNSDGRIRGLYQYHGAHTGRPAGRAVQPTNLPRPLIKGAWLLADLFHDNRIEDICLVYEDPTFAVADALRSLFTAAPGYELYAGDFKSVEAVVTAGVAGERWKLDAFQAVLDGKGFVVDGVRYDDVYCATASKILGYLVTKAMQEPRQIGKGGELSFGFGGGFGAWMGTDPDTKFTEEEINRFKDAWREAHPRTKGSWRAVENHIIDAMFETDGTEWRGLRFERNTHGGNEFMDIVLANGKRLHYLRPKLGEEEPPWSTPEKPVTLPKFYYAGHQLLDGNRKIWSEHVGTYGGKLIENIVQATAREIQMDRMLAVNYDLKMPVVMHTYDETVVEVPKGDDRYKEFIDCLGEMPSYAPWPIGVDGWRGERNRK